MFRVTSCHSIRETLTAPSDAAAPAPWAAAGAAMMLSPRSRRKGRMASPVKRVRDDGAQVATRCVPARVPARVGPVLGLGALSAGSLPDDCHDMGLHPAHHSPAPEPLGDRRPRDDGGFP